MSRLKSTGAASADRAAAISASSGKHRSGRLRITGGGKRGGGCDVISLDAETAESLYAANVASLPAESLYEKRWALTLLETVMHRLKAEHEGAGKLAEYELLKHCLTADRGDIRYDALAAALGVEPTSARSAVHRLRKRFREVFRDEVAETVADPGDVDAEMRAVISALGNE